MNVQFFNENRKRVAEVLRGVLVLSGYHAMQHANDAAAFFEQEANFWWLTGIEEPGWWVIIDDTRQKAWLVRPDVSDMHRVFDGSLSSARATQISGISDVIDQKQAAQILSDLASQGEIVFSLGDHPHADHFDFVFNPAQKEMWDSLAGIFKEVKDCRANLAKLRAIKQPEEIQAIREAINLTIEGFGLVKRKIDAYSFEYEIDADFSHTFRSKGATGHAYDPIVAVGKNACTLHYGKNQDKLVPGQLILMDVGARLGGYPADITRTYAYGEVPDRQKAVHAAVEKAHVEIIELLGPGISVAEYSDKVDEIMQRALESLGLMKSKKDYRKYFPHAISHGLGVDVHDSLGGPKTFQPGMILTVEPGIYIPEEGIGVRIEDDVLITETGYENLSAALPTSL